MIYWGIALLVPLGFIAWRFRSKKLESVLGRTKVIKIYGVRFRIKKLDPLAHLDGSNAMLMTYDIYENKKGSNNPKPSKVRDHMKDVFLNSVVEPKLARKETDEGLFVENLFSDFTLSNNLYEAIILYTYGKKKTLFGIFPERN